MTTSNPMWTRKAAEHFLRQVAPMFEAIGMRLAIVGSVATNGRSDKDLDVVVSTTDGAPMPIETALTAVFETFVPTHTVDTNQTLNPLPSHEPPNQTFVNFGLKDGRTLELFFPELQFPID